MFMDAPNQLLPRDQTVYQKVGGDPNIHYLWGYWKLAPDEAWLIELVEAGLLKPAGPETRPQHWRFDGIQLGRARRAYRLQRDFEASQAALALMMQLLDEVERLQRLLPR